MTARYPTLLSQQSQPHTAAPQLQPSMTGGRVTTPAAAAGSGHSAANPMAAASPGAAASAAPAVPPAPRAPPISASAGAPAAAAPVAASPPVWVHVPGADLKTLLLTHCLSAVEPRDKRTLLSHLAHGSTTERSEPQQNGERQLPEEMPLHSSCLFIPTVEVVVMQTPGGCVMI